MERDPRTESEPGTESDPRTGRAAAAARMQHQARWVDLQLRQAVERGEFDDLPGLGKPIEGLGAEQDPDWWVKRLVEREQVHLAPPAVALRREDAALDDRLDRLASPGQVRGAVAEFNERVRHTLYSNPGGPPVTTTRRDVEEEVRRWGERRDARIAAARAAARAAADSSPTPRERRGLRALLRRRR
jgi:hypothetical protein